MTRRLRALPPPADAFLGHTCTIRVRFHEVDSMGVVWHGHYLTFFEDARCALGRRYGLDYSDCFAHGLHAPVVHATVDWLAPARFGEQLVVHARLHADASARVDFTYRVQRDGDGEVLATGRTVQVLTTPDGELLLTRPPLLVAFWERWAAELESGRG